MKNKLIKTRLNSPYQDGNEKTNFPLRNKKGVYLIYKDEILMYVGSSGSDVYTTMYRHFQRWNDKTQFRAIYDRKKCKVRIIYTNTEKRARDLETALIIKHKPKDNTNKLQSILNFEEKAIYKEAEETQFIPNSEYKEMWD